jgi:hypothetical protein
LINHILLVCSSVFIYEFIRYIRLSDILKFNLKIFKKILKLFKYKNVSDFRKEKLIFNYSKSLFIVSMKIIVILISIIILLLILNIVSNSYLNLIMSILGIIEISIVFIIYHLIRIKYHAKL